MANDQNFLPEDYLAQKVARRTNVICVSLFVVVMAGVVGAYYVTNERWQQAVERQRQVDRQTEEAARRLDQLAELQVRKQEMLRKAGIIGSLVERTPRSIILSELTNHMPQSMTLLDFELQTEVLSTSRVPRSAIDRAKLQQQQKTKQQQQEIELPPTELSIDLTGVANSDVDVAQFMTSMRHHPLFEDVGLVFSEQTELEDMDKRKFRIKMMVNQELDITSIEPARVARGLDHNPMGDGPVAFPPAAPAREATSPGRSAAHPAN